MGLLDAPSYSRQKSDTLLAANMLCARMTVRPSRARRALIETLIGSLISAGVWDNLDGFYVLASHDVQAAKLNWVGAMQDLTAVNAPVFQVDRGFTGDGASSYLDTNVAANALEKFAVTDAAIGVYVRTTVSNNNAFDVGCVDVGSYINPNNTSGNVLVRANCNTGSAIAISNAGDNKGLFAWTRNAGDVHIYKDGALLGSSTHSSSQLPTTNYTLLRSNTGYSTRQLSAAFIGKGLSDSGQAALNTALSTFLTAIGAAV